MLNFGVQDPASVADCGEEGKEWLGHSGWQA